MKKFLMVLITAIMLCTLVVPCFASNSGFSSEYTDIPLEVEKEAQEALSWVGDTVLSDKDKWGLDESLSEKDLSLGQGVKVNYLNTERLEKKTPNTLSSVIADDSDVTWLYTIDANGVALIYLEIGYENGECKVLQYGGDASTYGKLRNELIKKYGRQNIVVLNGGSYNYFVYKEKGALKVLSESAEDQRNLLTYTNTNDVDLKTFSVAMNATIQANEIINKDEMHYGDGGILSKSETAQYVTQNNHSNLFILLGVGILALLGFGTVVVVRRRILMQRKRNH